jgi:TetR/AcrR family transcriptional regulator, regulator of cefoperazone and chloramphenicol sensitivity
MKSGLEAKHRIIEVAGEIFADRGFRETTVREICRRAGVNLAAINYHFGDKEHLYLSVLKHYKEIALQKFPMTAAFPENEPPDVQLAGFIRSFVYHILGQGQPSCFGKLMAKECIEPTSALEVIIEEEIRPFFNRLNAIVGQMLESQVHEENVHLHAMSILGQCLYFRNARPVISKLLHKDNFCTEEIEKITEHITKFSLAALSGLSKK